MEEDLNKGLAFVDMAMNIADLNNKRTLLDQLNNH